MKNQRIALLSLGAVAVATTAWAGSSRTQTTTSSAQARTSAVPAVATATAKDDGFRASEFAGVRVRERPAAALKAAGASGWIFLKPGGKMPESTGFGRASAVLQRGKGTSRLGGDKISGPGLMHSEAVVRQPDGSLSEKCTPDSDNAHAH